MRQLRHPDLLQTPNTHRLRRGLPGYLILFATHAFVPQRQIMTRKSPSPPVFLLISAHFTATLGIPLSLPYLKMSSFKSLLQLSYRISLLTCLPAYVPFTPNDSGQRSDLTYYRGCWHVISRSLFLWYCHFLPIQKIFTTRRPSKSRGVAASGFPPLCKIPHCCLPQESGPCLSPNVAVHSLKPATDRCLGGLLLHQLANQAQVHLRAINL